MNIVLFPSAKVVTQDLQDIGKFPAIIYPIDQMRMIDIFKRYYFDETKLADRFEVVTYEEHDQVIRRIENDSRIQIDKLDDLKDIGYTVWYGLSKANITEKDRIIINFSDIADLKDVGDQIQDRCFYSQEEISSKWMFFDENAGRITKYYERPVHSEDIETNNMMIGIFHIEKALLFKELLESAIHQKTKLDSFWVALQKYSEIRSFIMVQTNDWFDIGHIDKYYDTKMAIKSRTFNHITIDRNRGILKKTSEDKEKFIGEIRWYLKLPTDIEYSRPRIFSYSTNYETPYISMEYYAYRTLHELFLLGNLTEEQWCNVFRRIRFILNDFGRYSLKDKGIKDSLVEMYISKTISRLKLVKELQNFPVFDNPLIINGEEYISIHDVCDMLPQIVKDNLLDVDELHIIHGDLCFSNIMIDSNYSFIKMIDPRGKFGRYDIYGDTRYEYAKLMHSIDGKYDYIIKDRFEIYFKNNIIEYKVHYDQDADIVKCFERIFANEIAQEKGKIKLIEALLFFSMIPLHKESINQQIAMLATAYRCLSEVSNIGVQK